LREQQLGDEAEKSRRTTPFSRNSGPRTGEEIRCDGQMPAAEGNEPKRKRQLHCIKTVKRSICARSGRKVGGGHVKGGGREGPEGKN